MRRAELVLLAAGAVLAVALALLFLAPNARAVNDPGASGGTVTGDWSVTDIRSYSGVPIYIENGNLSVEAGASLTLTNVTLAFSSSLDGGFSLTVKTGAWLKLGDGTNITSNSSSVHYRFIVEGAMEMNKSCASEMWGDTGSWAGGIQIYNSSVSITNSTITRGRTGGISIFNSSPVIFNCLINNNGQDGQSTTYSYGIYGTGTGANITQNNISDNRYIIYNRYSYVVNKNPPGPASNTVLYNGNYYYKSNPNYRYEYRYTNESASVWGCGLWLEGRSRPSILNNTIIRNGWESGGYVVTMPASFDDAPGNSYRSTPYLYWYAGNKCFGNGIVCRNSTVEIRGNYIDRNGCDPYRISLSDLNYMSSYWGTGITLAGSGGNLTNNTIMNSVILINETDSSPNITYNWLFTDFIHTVLPSGFRIGYGILNYRSSPYIFANTITLTVEDQERTIGATSFFPMDCMVGIDNALSPGVVIDRNRIVTETRMQNYVAGIGVNATFLSNDLILVNNSIEHMLTGRGGTKTNMQYSTLVQLSFLSDTYMQNNTLKSNAQVGGGGGGGNVGGQVSTPVAGLGVSYGTNVKSLSCNITGMTYGVMLSDRAGLEATYLRVSGSIKYGLYIDQGCNVKIDRSQVTSSGTAGGVMVSGSKVSILDSSMNDPLEIVVDKGAAVELLNTTHSRESYLALDNASWLNISWPVRMRLTWQDGTPVDNASVSVQNIFGEVIYSGTTGPDGRPAPVVWVMEYAMHNMSIVKFRPNPIFITKGRTTSMTISSIGGPMDLALLLVDSIPPDLLVETPSNGTLINSGTVDIRGEVLEKESGLKASSVEINIDNIGWTSLPVAGGRWNYTGQFRDGTHICWVRATDRVGNSAMVPLIFTIDTTPPSLSVLSPLDMSFSGQRTITVFGTSDPGAVVTVNGKVAGMEGRTFSTRLSLEEGANLVTVVAVDGAGNSITVAARVTLDTVQPVLTVVSPVNGSSSALNVITIYGTTEALASVLVGGQRSDVTGTDFQTTYSLYEGINDIPVVAVDRAGNSNSLTLRVMLVTRPPDLSLFGPPDGLWTNVRNILVTGTSVRGVSVMVNGIEAAVSGTLFSISITLNDGANRIEVVARDAAGNTNTVERTIYLDTLPPGLTIVSPAEGSAIASRIVTVVGTADQDAVVEVDGKPVDVVDFVFRSTLSFTADGTFHIEVTARDAAGNTALVVRTVVVDTATPLIYLDSPAEGAKVSGRTVDVSGRTEPFATVIINDMTMVVADAGGLFSARVVLGEGTRDVTVRSVNAAGATASVTRMVRTSAPPVASSTDPWMLALSGLLMEMGIAALVVAVGMVVFFRARRGGKDGKAAEKEAEADEKNGEEAPDEENGEDQDQGGEDQ